MTVFPTKKVIEVKDLHVHFYTYAGVVKAISGVSFEIYEGETFCLVGETGCGKSVTSRALTRLIESPGRIVKGQIIFYRDSGPVDIMTLSEEELREIRGKEIAYIFQDPTAALDPLFTVGYQIAETMVAHRTANWKEAFRKAVNILKSVIMPDPERRVKNYPHELSGGMRQRVVIGISLSNKPKLLIADEPTTNLDVTIQAQILDLLRELKKNEQMTLLLITHNMGVVAEMCTRVAVMYAGKIVEVGPVMNVFKDPKHPYTKGLLKAVPNPLGKIGRLESIPGTVPNLIHPPPGCRFHPRCPYIMEVCKSKEPPMIDLGEGRKVACWLYVK